MAGGGPFMGGGGFGFNNRNQVNQAAIDAAIKKQLEAQQNAITNNIVRKSQNVPYRDPMSYFQGFSGSPYLRSAQGSNAIADERNARSFRNIPVSNPQKMAQDNYQQQIMQLLQQYNLLG